MRFYHFLPLFIFTPLFAGVDLPQGSTSQLLRSTAEVNNVQIIAPADLPGSYTAFTTDAPLSSVFTASLLNSGYSWHQTGSLVTVSKDLPVDEILFLANVTSQSFSFPGVTSIGDHAVRVTSTTRYEFDRLAALVRAVDKLQRKVRVTAKITEITKSAAKQLGIAWQTSGVPIQISTTGKALTISSFSALASALDANSGTKTISEPSVVVLDGKTASVAVGDQYPLPQYTFSQDTGTVRVSGFQYKDIGIKLDVTPRITNIITLDVTVDVSTASSTVQFQGVELPVISTRNAKTTLSLKSGESTIIGGLISQKELEKGSRVPGLSKLPVLGSLFKNKNKSHDETQLIVLITAVEE